MSALFDAAVAMVLRLEGPGSDDPFDLGGRTRYGISSRAHPDVDLDTLTTGGAIELYHERYWTPIRGDELPGQVAIICFDCAVNQGVATAIRLLQRAVLVEVDGVLGPQTLAAVRARPHDKVALDLLAWRAMTYAAMPPLQLGRYGKGWFRRVFECQRVALELGLMSLVTEPLTACWRAVDWWQGTSAGLFVAVVILGVLTCYFARLARR